MGAVLLKLAVVYLVAGVGLGIFMAASHDHTAMPVHAHINLLGWASLALCGLIHLQFPDLQRHWLAKAHFGLHNAGLPLGMIALFFVLHGQAALMPVVGVGSAMAGLGVACFALLILLRVRSPSR